MVDSVNRLLIAIRASTSLIAWTWEALLTATPTKDFVDELAESLERQWSGYLLELEAGDAPTSQWEARLTRWEALLAAGGEPVALSSRADWAAFSRRFLDVLARVLIRVDPSLEVRNTGDTFIKVSEWVSLGAPPPVPQPKLRGIQARQVSLMNAPAAILLGASVQTAYQGLSSSGAAHGGLPFEEVGRWLVIGVLRVLIVPVVPAAARTAGDETFTRWWLASNEAAPSERALSARTDDAMKNLKDSGLHRFIASSFSPPVSQPAAMIRDYAQRQATDFLETVTNYLIEAFEAPRPLHTVLDTPFETRVKRPWPQIATQPERLKALLAETCTTVWQGEEGSLRGRLIDLPGFLSEVSRDTLALVASRRAMAGSTSVPHAFNGPNVLLKVVETDASSTTLNFCRISYCSVMQFHSLAASSFPARFDTVDVDEAGGLVGVNVLVYSRNRTHIALLSRSAMCATHSDGSPVCGPAGLFTPEDFANDNGTHKPIFTAMQRELEAEMPYVQEAIRAAEHTFRILGVVRWGLRRWAADIVFEVVLPLDVAEIERVYKAIAAKAASQKLQGEAYEQDELFEARALVLVGAADLLEVASGRKAWNCVSALKGRPPTDSFLCALHILAESSKGS